MSRRPKGAQSIVSVRINLAAGLNWEKNLLAGEWPHVHGAVSDVAECTNVARNAARMLYQFTQAPPSIAPIAQR